ncbi:PQQ-like beta-propeller repeat protein [Streptomyces sp. S1A1-8]|uniref:S8 family serine peptidase n=1 Tax=unclassified Streptomyces TaxID=2593676 RepID=UPI001165861D|nr:MULTISPECIES: S8 family serine peptidase [unclassified Streptomyces]QDO25667.1 PQQ-like beta-propeller repeat protein [Streptomyces sp. S1A1-8]QDO35784.1 PQQ-like beta-propeller repeat protein [Streptomyces sp. S1A1-3]
MTYAHTRGRRLGAVGVALVAITAAVTIPAAAIPSSSPGPGSAATDSGAKGTSAGAALPSTPGSSALGPWRSFLKPTPAQSAKNSPHQVLVVLGSATQVTGKSLGKQRNLQVRTPLTSDTAVNTALQRAHAVSMRPLMPELSAAQAKQLRSAAQAKLGSGAIDLSKVQVVQLAGGDATAAARALAATPGVVYAEPDQTVSPMNTGSVPLPSSVSATAGKAGSSAKGQDSGAPGSDGVPDNAGLGTSVQSFLNAGGVDATGAYSLLKRKFNQLPGTGETITNVSVGDLTDESNAAQTGPTTVVQNGQRYLDIPTMPLIPTYTADAGGALDPTGSTRRQDDTLGEVLLDFSVMAPLPHELQRPGMQGSGSSDLLGIAPGANYRLVVPQEPTFSQIGVALLAAARQQPRPNVITASLGYGTDAAGLPGRYLEDDPVLQAVIASIVQQYGITVVVSSNDGTRLFTNAAVGPDGGSTPTDVTRKAADTTRIDDDQLSTTPSKVLDSGAIAAGATTTDDTLSVPPQNGGAASANGTWATTRLNGSGVYSSGFGTRVDLSAPGDGIPAFEHLGQTAQSVKEVLTGGTSASAPEIAAAAAVVLQTSRLTGQHPSPQDVRSLLERTGRAVPTPPQIDQPLHVGPQLDVTAAMQAVLAKAHGSRADSDTPRIVRLSVAHRQTIGGLGGAFLEETDPGRIDLSGPGTGAAATGEGLVGPVTIGADVTGLSDRQGVSYVLRIGRHEFASDVPAIRLTPRQMLTAAGLPVVSATDRQVSLTFEVRHGHQVLASATHELTFGPTDGGYVESLAPVVQPVVRTGHSVQVSYDLTGVRNVSSPQLVVSGVGHWNPAAAPIFSASYTTPLTGLRGTLTVPADAFSAGGGIYGIGIMENPTGNSKGGPLYGEFASIRVDGAAPSQRPAAPTLAAKVSGEFGHLLEINRAAPQFSVHYDVSGIPGATGTLLEFSAPGPNIYGSYNLVSNQDGTTRDHDGVDSPATLDRPLKGTKGTVDFDALALKLPSSIAYDLRVFAVDSHGTIVGQASPTSLLGYDDGLAPDGTNLTDFAIVPGGTSVVAVESPTGEGSVYDYNAATGTYGRKLTSDPAYGSIYEVFGVDSAHHTLVLHKQTTTGEQWLETYDTSTGNAVGSPVRVDDQYVVTGGRVDAKRHRAAVLAYRSSDRAGFVLPVDLATGTQGEPLELATPDGPSQYSLLEVDESTGVFFAQSGILINANCVAGLGSGTVAAINLDSGTVTHSQGGSPCAGDLASDQKGNLYEMWYHRPSRVFAGTEYLSQLGGGDPVNLGNQPDLGVLAVDGVHQLALLAFKYPELKPTGGFQQYGFTDNNGTGRIVVVDLKTGKTVRTVTGVEYPQFGSWTGQLDSHHERVVQLDPATRTGWTYAGDGSQIQQFSY